MRFPSSAFSTRVLPPTAFLVLALTAALGASLTSARPARAEVNGPCGATIAGSDIVPLSSTSSGDAISVDSDQRVEATMSSSQGFRSHKIDLVFLGFGEIGPSSRTVERRTDNGETSFTETVKVSDYAWLGVGYYKVRGAAVLADGTACSGAALVKVTGRNPLTTVAGGVAAGVAVAATAGAVVSGAAAAAGRPRPLSEVQEMVDAASQEEDMRRREEEMRNRATRPETPNILFARWLIGCFCMALIAILLTPLMALTGAGGTGGERLSGPRQPAPVPAGGPALRLPRARWLPRITLLGIFSGLLAGAAGLVLIQQFAIAYPSKGLAITLLIVGAVAYGLVVPTLGYTLAWLRINGRVAKLERSIGWR